MWTTQFVQMQFMAEKHGWTKFISMQNHYNLYREEEREMNPFCNSTGVGLIPVRFLCGVYGFLLKIEQWAPLCRGHLARPVEDFGTTIRSKPELEKGQSEIDVKTITRVQELAEKKGWKMSQVALA